MKEVEVGGTVLEFPDSMSDEQIKSVLQKKFPPKKARTSDPASSIATGLLEMAAPYFVQNPAKAAAKSLDDQVRATAQGMTFNYADEAAAKANELTGQGTYEQNVAQERARDEQMPAFTQAAGNIGGGLATASGLGKLGVTALKGASPTALSLGTRGAAEGAAYGAAYGSGAATEGNRAQGAMEGATVGALTGGITGAATGGIAKALMKDPAPSLEAIKNKSVAAFQESHNSGVRVSPQAMEGLKEQLEKVTQTMGYSKRLEGHGNIGGILDEIGDRLSSPQSFQDLHILRRIIQNAGKSGDASARAISSKMLETFDDYLINLKPYGVIGGKDPKAATEALRTGIKEWSRYSKAKTIEDIIENAEISAGQYSVSGMENALRVQFKGLATNPKRLRVFTAEEQALIKKAAKTPLRLGALRLLGKLAFRGPVSGLGVGAGYAAGGAPGATGVALAGEGGKLMSSAMRRASVNRILEQIKTGKITGIAPEDAQLLSSLIVGEQAGRQ